MKQVSLIYGYSSRNAGDFAITLGAIDVLLSLGCKIKLFSRYCAKNKDYHESLSDLRRRYGNQIDVYESPFCLDRTDSLSRTVLNYTDGAFSLVGLKGNNTFKENLLASDYVIFNGGNLFRCNSIIDFTRLCALMYPLNIAVKKDKPIIIFPQSASVLNKVGRQLLIPILQKAKTVFFREKESYNYMKTLMDVSDFHTTIDLAFFINKQNLLVDVKYKDRIAITLRFHTVGDIKYLPQSKIDQIFSRLEKIVNKYKDSYSFILIVQTNKDEELSKKFAEQHGIDLFKSNDPIELLSIYKSVNLLIGMRLHSIILALSVGTPCFGLFYKEWGLKNPGLMKDFNMPFCLLDDCQTVVEQDILSVDDLLKNREKYSQQILQKVSKEYQGLVNRLSYLKK